MRRIKKKEREKAGHIYCPFCKPARVEATWRKEGYIDLRTDVACETHKDKVIELKDDHLTEADMQTWMRL